MDYKNVGSHPVELTGGQTVGMGETVTFTGKQEKDEHNKIYIEEGFFLSLDDADSEATQVIEAPKEKGA